MKRSALVLVLLSLAASSVFAKTTELGCMSRYLNGILDINQARRSIYADQTQGQSKSVSDSLTMLQRRLLVGADEIDALALPYQQKGVPVVCEDVGRLEDIPVYRTSFTNGAPSEQNFQKINSNEISGPLFKAIQGGDFATVKKVSNEWLKILSAEPRYNCLMRSFLESIRRSADVALKYDEGAEISKKIIRGQIFSLRTVSQIDKLAKSIQTAGVPILCQDLPSTSNLN